MPSIPIPPHRRSVAPWRQEFRGGTREDRMLRKVEVQRPPLIADLDVVVPAELRALTDDALREIAAVDETHGLHLQPLSLMLLRAESVASSKIERIEASVDDYARALHGVKANTSATSMVASTRALDQLINAAAGDRTFEITDVLAAHKVLMAEDPHEKSYAGRLRDMQNWIGGSDWSPREALYVPPPAETVAGYLDDLATFVNRDDLGVLEQAAVVHAQFESIHPFTDGNGRIGRALINTVFRRRGATRRVVIPLASAVVARRDEYFAALGAYRDGDLAPLLTAFTTASALAARESRVTAQRLAELPDHWRERAGRPRKGSAAAKLLDNLTDHPIFSADDATAQVGGATSSLYTAIERLHAGGVIRPLTDRARNQVWIASALADELEDLGVRIAARAR
ncbi:Fic family protein [Nocardioides sp. Bht2]|uniref:Fic family protein n=1 Tax=Nocardioides sp. Bht2 TaxID=3392297 RepID=UPI0039B44E2F